MEYDDGIHCVDQALTGREIEPAKEAGPDAVHERRTIKHNM